MAEAGRGNRSRIRKSEKLSRMRAATATARPSEMSRGAVVTGGHGEPSQMSKIHRDVTGRESIALQHKRRATQPARLARLGMRGRMRARLSLESALPLGAMSHAGSARAIDAAPNRPAGSFFSGYSGEIAAEAMFARGILRRLTGVVPERTPRRTMCEGNSPVDDFFDRPADDLSHDVASVKTDRAGRLLQFLVDRLQISQVTVICSSMSLLRRARRTPARVPWAPSALAARGYRNA